MYTKECFKAKLISKLEMVFKNVVIKDDIIIITEGQFEVTIPFENVFLEFQVKGDFLSVADNYIGVIKDAISNHSLEINYTNLYPLIKNADFGVEEGIDFVRETFVLDLDILFAIDMETSFKFILKSDNVNVKKIKENAFRNLNKIAIPLVRLDTGLEIYSSKFNSDYASSLLLSDSIKLQINKKIGRNYLFCVPSASGLLVAKNRPDYIGILKSIIAVDNDPNKVSDDKVYRFINGKYEYADLK